MTGRRPLLVATRLPLATRLRLAPYWLVSLTRRNPGAVVFTAGLAVVVAGLVVLAVWGPHPVCHLRGVVGAVRPHWTCMRGAR